MMFGTMSKWVKYGLLSVFSLILGVFFFAPAITHAQLSPSNPFKDAQDSGSAEEVNLIWTESWQDDAFINVVRWVINRTLGIMGLIALIILLWWGFLMVTAAWDSDRYSKWFTILKQAALWLVLIGVARFIISLVFWLIQLTGEAADPAWTDG